SFSVGVKAPEIAGLLAALGEDTERGGTPIGLLAPEERPHWEHAQLYPVGYERLELSRGGETEGEEGDRVGGLWLALAQAALAVEPSPDAPPDASEVARGIRSREGGSDEAYDQVIVGYLHQLADELKNERGPESDQVRRRVSSLLKELDDATLQRLLGFGGEPAQRHRFLMDASQSLAVDSVVRVLQAAASSQGQSISHSMTRLLNKLAVHAGGSGARHAQADTALRENVEALVSGWELQDPNPEAYTGILDSMSRAAPLFHAPDEDEKSLSGALRLVEMALEVDTYGPTVSRALSDLIRDGEANAVIRLLGEASPANAAAQAIREHLTSPGQFRRLLASGGVDEEGLGDLVAEMGSHAVDPLLDVLADSDSRSVRRLVYDTLRHMGPFVGKRAAERLQDPRWFVQRNMLALLARLDHVPEDFDPRPFVEHADPRVRREAFPLGFRRTRLRDRTLAAALSDQDERAVRMALLELQHGVPDPVLPTLVNRVVLPTTRSPEIRALGARVLGGNHSPLACKALVTLATSGKTLFGKPRLAPNTPETAAALHVLARFWAGSDEVDDILEQAARSKDPELRGAVRSASSATSGVPEDASGTGGAA
ncbi:MAG: hypothetical protein PVJ02_12140, partial [Gemmatimonadota bacterium]